MSLSGNMGNVNIAIMKKVVIVNSEKPIHLTIIIMKNAMESLSNFGCLIYINYLNILTY